MKHPIRLMLVVVVIIVLILLITTTVSSQNNTETNVDYDPICTTMTMVHYSPNPTNESMDSTVLQAPPPTTIYIKEETPEPEPEPEPAAYQEIADVITDDEIEMLARLLFLEAGNQSIEGQRAVIEVVFNRLLSDEFPNTLNDVVYAENQFSPAHLIPSTTPTDEQYEVIQIVLTDTETVLDRGVVFFSRGQYNDYLYDKIGDHYFCYSTKSYQNMKGTEQ